MAAYLDEAVQEGSWRAALAKDLARRHRKLIRKQDRLEAKQDRMERLLLNLQPNNARRGIASRDGKESSGRRSDDDGSSGVEPRAGGLEDGSDGLLEASVGRRALSRRPSDA
eukprot:1612747-Prymnesium_polylepis.1